MGISHKEYGSEAAVGDLAEMNPHIPWKDPLTLVAPATYLVLDITFLWEMGT